MRIAVTASPVTAYAAREPGRGVVALVARDGARAILAAFAGGRSTPAVAVESWYPVAIPANHLVAIAEVDGAEAIVAVYGPAK